MKFKHVEIHGFKSFAEKYELFFHEGLTGIVGPNGCGKSNIVEAIRWVMGESSARKMRGTEMDDVIFNGTQGRARRNYAQVTLVLDNHDFSAPEKFNAEEELVITRRIERGSGSSYQINGGEVRARDVQLLFADLSAGASSAGQVSQGRVAEIINQRPQERRQLLEEAAGIRGLRVRRHEAELKLKQTRENLVRIDDIVDMLNQQNDALLIAACKAKEYRLLSSTINELQGKRLYAEYMSAKLLQQRQQAQLEKAKIVLDKEQGKLTALKIQLETQDQKIKQLQEALLIKQASGKRYEIELENFDQLAQIRQQEFKKLQARLDEIVLENRELITRQDRVTQQHTYFTTEIKKLGQDFEKPEENLQILRSAQQNLQQQHQQAQTQINTLTHKRAECQAMHQALEKEQLQLEVRLKKTQENHAARHQQVMLLRDDTGIALKKNALEEQLNRYKAQLVQEKTTLNLIDNQQLVAVEAKLLQGRGQLELVQQNIKEQLVPMQEKMTHLSAKIETLSSLLSQQEMNFTPMVDKIQVAEGFETALGAALGDDLQAALDPEASIFWQLSSLAHGSPLPEGVRHLGEFVKAPSVLKLRLSQIGIVFDVSKVEDFVRELKLGQRLVSKQGELWRWDGFTVRAEAASAAGQRLEQRNLLESLVEERGLLEEKLLVTQRMLEAENQDAVDAVANYETDLHNLRQKSRQVHTQYNQSQNSIHQTEQEYARFLQNEEQKTEQCQRLTVELQNFGDEVSELEEAREILQNRLAEASVKDNFSEEIQNISVLIQQIDEKLRAKNTEIEQLKTAEKMRDERLRSLKASLLEWQAHKDSVALQLQRLTDEIGQVKESLKEKNMTPEVENDKRQQILDLITSTGTEIVQINEKIKQLYDQIMVGKSDIAVVEGNIRKVQESEIRTDEGQRINNERLQDIIVRIEEEFSVVPERLPDRVGFCHEEKLPSLEQLSNMLKIEQHQRDLMGEVNLRAESEQIESAQRLEEVTVQSEDLKVAITELERGIRHLNQEAEKYIIIALEAVNNHFSELFVRLFGGGKAMIKLDTPKDPLNSGLEIFASPPGKKLYHLSLLSGGEQALTALSLIFAVFMVKPLPICILDEVDAPLDDDNVRRLCDLLEELAKRAQTRFLMITHHRMSMSRCQYLYGVTMAEKGISRMVTVDMAEQAA